MQCYGVQMIHAVGPDFVVAEDDVLFFAGALTHVQDLADAHKLRPVMGSFEEEMPAILGTPQVQRVPLAHADSAYSQNTLSRFSELDGNESGAQASDRMSLELVRASLVHWMP
jgi:hypothetical protein